MILAADRVILGDGKTVLENHVVEISGQSGKIVRIIPMDTLTAEGKTPDVCYPGCTLMPGLIDMHVHISAFNKPFGFAGSDFAHAYATLHNAEQALTLGVTTLRSVADKNKLVASLVWAKENGYISTAIPRIIPCGNGICMTGGHGSEFPDGGDIADGPWALRKRVRQNIMDGAQWIKLLTSRREEIPEFTQEELNAAVDECHRRKHKVAVHSGMHCTVQMCIDAGVDTIEHGTYMTVDQAETMRDKGIAWTPTMMVYSEMAKKFVGRSDAAAKSYQRAAEAYCTNFKKLYDTGVTVLAGTDVPADSEGVITYRELEYMVDYGITPLQAIQTATENPARVLDLGDVTGAVKPGLAADLLIVAGDPSKNISDVRNVTEVYQNGVSVYRKTAAEQ